MLRLFDTQANVIIYIDQIRVPIGPNLYPNLLRMWIMEYAEKRRKSI